MRRLPEAFLKSIEEVPGFNRPAFEAVHASETQVTSIRINPSKPPGAAASYQAVKEVPWCTTGFYLEQRPSFTFDPLFHAGCYYVQEASSMFLEQAFKQLLENVPIKVLDLCAAPGGKSTHIQTLLPEGSLLVSNEVIRNRSLALIDNIIKWGCSNAIICNNDPAAFSKLPGYFDVMVVDAPCSGSGLFRRDPDAIEEWSLSNVQLCCQRQKRILADALPALKNDGLLVYSTCSYSQLEDESIADWLVEEMDMEPLELVLDERWNIISSRTRTGAVGYRFYPDRLEGEGFFLSCFRKKNEPEKRRLKMERQEKLPAKEEAIIRPWLQNTLPLIKEREQVFMMPEHVLNSFLELRPVLNVMYKGTAIGQVMKDKLVPHHALAQCVLLNRDIPGLELSYEEAVKYLQRQELDLRTDTKGWHLACYKNFNLGWINVLSNRINNYYPKELRILKQSNDAGFEK
ncbi:MAG: methyltransferase RsmF C-terminal domain-like protein [Flavisolibacter sp.]